MKSTLLIAIAIGCGLIAALGVLQYVQQAPAPKAVQQRQVVVAVKEIDINSPLTQDNLRLVNWPDDQVPAGAIEELKELENKYARIRLYPGEVLLPGKVMGSDDTSGSVRVPQGYRVVSVKSNAETAVSNLIEPGDRVDVIAVLGARARTSGMAKAILRAVRVFAINREMSRNPDGSVAADGARTVSLVVTPAQAEKLMMASELGEIRLALRSPDDPQVDETAGCTVRDVLGGGSVADETTPDGQLANVTSRPAFDILTDLAAEEDTAAEPAWTMLLLSPERSQTFTWNNHREAPREGAVPRPQAEPSPPVDEAPAAGPADETPAPEILDSGDMAHWSPRRPLDQPEASRLAPVARTP